MHVGGTVYSQIFCTCEHAKTRNYKGNDELCVRRFYYNVSMYSEIVEPRNALIRLSIHGHLCGITVTFSVGSWSLQGSYKGRGPMVNFSWITVIFRCHHHFSVFCFLGSWVTVCGVVVTFMVISWDKLR